MVVLYNWVGAIKLKIFLFILVYYHIVSTKSISLQDRTNRPFGVCKRSVETLWLLMRYFYVNKPISAGETVVLKGDDVRHIRNVLRLNRGDRIGLLDGQGHSSTAQIESIKSSNVTVKILSCSRMPDGPAVKLVIAQAYLKDKKMDDLVRQLTALGTSVWIPFCSERSVSRPDSQRLRARLERWGKISREALKQCRRGRTMEIEPVDSFHAVLSRATSCDLRILFWEDETRPLDINKLTAEGAQIKEVCAILGPEGGFSPAEVDTAVANGFVTAGLGPRTLRTETATVAAAALLQFLYGDMGKKP
jgi:16S rRNA (uracil1498-N3)-methyltransferase